jgi:hypothetical protein
MSMTTPDLSGVQCTRCGVVGQLRIETRLEAKPLGTWSLSGVQTKAVLESCPWMVCDACEAECKGKFG